MVWHVPVVRSAVLSGQLPDDDRARWLSWRTTRAIESRWPTPERIAVVGSGPEATRVIEILQRYSEPSMAVVGTVGLAADSDSRAHGLLGTTNRLAEIVNRERVDRLIVVDGCLSERELRHCRETANRMGLVVSHVMAGVTPNVRVSLAEIGMLCLVDLRPVTITRNQERIKRILDLSCGVATLLVLTPLMLAIALAVKLTSEGPVLFVAPRVGRGGRYFYFYKFRSMYNRPPARRGDAGQRKERSSVQDAQRSADYARGPLSAALQPGRVAATDQCCARRHEPGRAPALPAEDLTGDGTSADFHQWAEQRARVLPGITRSVAGEGPQRPGFRGHGAAGCGVCAELVGGPGSEDPAAHAQSGFLRTRRLLSAVRFCRFRKSA